MSSDNKTKHIKVLPLESWMKYDPSCEGLYKKAKFAGINREGYYLTADKCWYEVNGEVFDYSTERIHFLYSLKLMNHRPLTKKTRAALLLLCKESILDKKMLELLNTDTEWLQLRDIRQTVQKAALLCKRKSKHETV